MDVRHALKEQYHGGLAMLAECVERCPEEIWVEGEHPRAFWRVAWHAAYFAHNYLVQDEEAFNGPVGEWPAAIRTALGVSESQRAMDVEPYELPEGAQPIARRDILDYIAYLQILVDSTIDCLELERPDTGFRWYPNLTKISHELMSLRHLQGHVGQLSERLMAQGIDTHWVAKAARPETTSQRLERAE